MIPKDADLLRWWQAYLNFSFLHNLQGERYPEFSLSVEIAGKRLMATFDLLVVLPGEHMYVFDWKTYKHSPQQAWFLSRLQTRVYSYVASKAGGALFGAEVPPDQVTMIYWTTSSPDTPVHLPYSAERLQKDDHFLRDLIARIDALLPDVSEPKPGISTWMLTGDSKKCAFCEYRSLCGRGDIPGFGEENEVFLRQEFDFLGLADVEDIGF